MRQQESPVALALRNQEDAFGDSDVELEPEDTEGS